MSHKTDATTTATLYIRKIKKKIKKKRNFLNMFALIRTISPSSDFNEYMKGHTVHRL